MDTISSIIICDGHNNKELYLALMKKFRLNMIIVLTTRKGADMELLLKKELIDLGRNVRGITIICTEGQCWLTQSGDSRDHVLKAGASFQAKQNGQLVITATGYCRIKLSQPEQISFHPLRKILAPGFSTPHFS